MEKVSEEINNQLKRIEQLAKVCECLNENGIYGDFIDWDFIDGEYKRALIYLVLVIHPHYKGSLDLLSQIWRYFEENHFSLNQQVIKNLRAHIDELINEGIIEL